MVLQLRWDGSSSQGPPCLSPFPHETGGFETDPSPPSIRSLRYQAQSKGRDEVATMASSTRAVILLLFCLSDQAVRHTQGVVFVRSKAVASATALVCGDQRHGLWWSQFGLVCLGSCRIVDLRVSWETFRMDADRMGNPQRIHAPSFNNC